MATAHDYLALAQLQIAIDESKERYLHLLKSGAWSLTTGHEALIQNVRTQPLIETAALATALQIMAAGLE